MAGRFPSPVWRQECGWNGWNWGKNLASWGAGKNICRISCAESNKASRQKECQSRVTTLLAWTSGMCSFLFLASSYLDHSTILKLFSSQFSFICQFYVCQVFSLSLKALNHQLQGYKRETEILSDKQLPIMWLSTAQTTIIAEWAVLLSAICLQSLQVT